MLFLRFLAVASVYFTSTLAAQLNIVTVGASITFGFFSSQGNGYRDNILYSLQHAKNDVRMLGTQHGGSCYQPFSEGYPGYVIDQVQSTFSVSFSKLQYVPNVIVTLVGTNDQQPAAEDVAGAPARFNTLLDSYRTLCPDCVIVASSLPPNGNAQQNVNINYFNAAIKVIVGERRAAGEHILFSDGNSGLTVADDMAVDQYHPNDKGYAIIGERMADQIKSAVAMGWTKSADDKLQN